MLKAVALGACGLAVVVSGASTRGTKRRGRMEMQRSAEATGLTVRETSTVQALAGKYDCIGTEGSLLGQVGHILAKIEKRADEVKDKWIADRDALAEAKEKIQGEYDAATAGPWTEELAVRDAAVASAQRETATLVNEVDATVAKKEQARADAESAFDAKKKMLDTVQMAVRSKKTELEDFGEEARQEYMSAEAKAHSAHESYKAVAEADLARRTETLGKTIAKENAKCEAALSEWHTMAKMDDSMVSSISDALAECAKECGDVHFVGVAKATKDAVTSGQASAIHQSWLQLGAEKAKNMPQRTNIKKGALRKKSNSGSGSSSWGSKNSPYGALSSFAHHVDADKATDRWAAAISLAVSNGEAQHTACLEQWDTFSKKELARFQALKMDTLRLAAKRLKSEDEAAAKLRDDNLHSLKDAVTEAGIHIPDLTAEMDAAKNSLDMAKFAADKAIATKQKLEHERADFETMVKNDAQSKMDADVGMKKATLLEDRNEKVATIDIERESRKSEFDGRMRDVQSELAAVRSIEAKLKELLDYSTHKEVEIILLSTSMDPGTQIGDFSSGEQRGKLADAATTDYRFGKTGAQLAEAGLFKLKVRDVSTGKTVVFQFEDGEKPGAGFDGAVRDCNAPGTRLGKLNNGHELFWHSGAGGCLHKAHMGFSMSPSPLMDCKHDTKAEHASVIMHWGHFHRRNADVSSMYAFGSQCTPEEHMNDGREVLKHRIVITGYFSDMPDLAKQSDPDAGEDMFTEKPGKKAKEIAATQRETGLQEKATKGFEGPKKLSLEAWSGQDGGHKAPEVSGVVPAQGGAPAKKEAVKETEESKKQTLEEWSGEARGNKAPEAPEASEVQPEDKSEPEPEEPKETPGPDGSKLAPNKAGGLNGWAGSERDEVTASGSGFASSNSLR